VVLSPDTVVAAGVGIVVAGPAAAADTPLVAEFVVVELRWGIADPLVAKVVAVLEVPTVAAVAAVGVEGLGRGAVVVVEIGGGLVVAVAAVGRPFLGAVAGGYRWHDTPGGSLVVGPAAVVVAVAAAVVVVVGPAVAVVAAVVVRVVVVVPAQFSAGFCSVSVEQSESLLM
jgi:hypothetical protein